MIIREVVREEIRLGLKEIVGEINQPTQETKPVFEKKNYSKNSVLNDVLNETAQDGDWKTLGGGEFTTDRMNELVGKQYGDVMNEQPQVVSPSDPMAQFVNKDYRQVLQKTEEKQNQKYGK